MQILSEIRGDFHGKRAANAQQTEKTGAVGRERVKACRSSGRTVKDWCKESGIHEQTYYRWQKRLFEIAKQQQERRFAEVTPERMDRVDGITVTVRVAGVEVDIRSGADAVTVETVLRVKSFQPSSFSDWRYLRQLWQHLHGMISLPASFCQQSRRSGEAALSVTDLIIPDTQSCCQYVLKIRKNKTV